MFNVIIIGGESTKDYEFFKRKCIQCLREKAKTDIIMLYTTGDRFVERFSKQYRLNIRYFYADFKNNGNNALKIRNEKLTSDANALIAFNTGLKDIDIITDICKTKNIPTRLIAIN